MCVVSDCLCHNTITVHRCLYNVLSHMKQLCSGINKIYYFSDGAASQYKNFKNVCNLLYHLDDFALYAEWHFFATSHSKNACDGVGGTVKQKASKASLQVTVVGHILTAKNLYDWGAGHLLNITLFFISKEEVSAHVDHQENRLSNVKTVPGTWSYQCFVPNPAEKTMVVQRLSGNERSFETALLTAPNEGDATVGCTLIGHGLPTVTLSVS